MKAMIVGAGIGGLAMALSLHAAGIDVVVYESVPEIKALGVGINLQPNAVRELIELGLRDALAGTAIETAELHYYNKHGQLIWSEPRGLAVGNLWPQYSISRGDLQMILLNAVKHRIGTDNVLTGHHLLSIEQDGSGVTARFVDRGSGSKLPLQRGDILIGCDGIRSTIRSQLYPDEGLPVSSGYVQWRGTIEAEPFLDGDRFFHQVKDWNFGWIKFADLICDASEIFKFVEQDREPLPRWSFGKVTLVGDAAPDAPARCTSRQPSHLGRAPSRVHARRTANRRAGPRSL
jgi:5-methylphenazine-1-carboxylate 1-monooxygenase